MFLVTDRVGESGGRQGSVSGLSCLFEDIVIAGYFLTAWLFHSWVMLLAPLAIARSPIPLVGTPQQEGGTALGRAKRPAPVRRERGVP